MTATASPAATLDQLVADAKELASLPQVVMQVIDLTVDQNATATDLERIVGMDPALAGKILALANSSYYGLPRRVSSLREAIVFLGFKAIRNLAMAITTFNLFLGKSDSPSLARRELWRHAMDTAQCARLVGTRLHPSDRESFGSDEAFTCGLLHDIGKLVLDNSRHGLFVTISEAARSHGIRYHEVEIQALPWTHAQLGMAVAAKWNLPIPVCETVGFHHTPRGAQLNPRLTATVALGNEIAHYISPPASDRAQDIEVAWESFIARCEDALTILRLSHEEVRSVSVECRSEIERGLSSQMCS